MTEPDRPADPVPPVRPGNFLLELVLVPVSDIDRAKAFYSERAGFGVDVDVRPAPFTVIHPMAYVGLDLNRRGKHERTVA